MTVRIVMHDVWMPLVYFLLEVTKERERERERASRQF
jgi:hypothetical protein